MDTAMLREQTRAEHEAVEAAVPLTEPNLTASGYIQMLQRFATVVGAWDAVAASQAPQAHAALVRSRRRSESLAADLDFFHAEHPPAPSGALLQQIRDIVGPADSPGHDSRFLGAMYVVEGSTLGGQFVAHHVESSLGLEPGHGDRFFRGYGKQTMPMWREFQQVLQQIPDGESERVVHAARAMFGIFRAWLAPVSAPVDSGLIPPPERMPGSAQAAS